MPRVHAAAAAVEEDGEVNEECAEVAAESLQGRADPAAAKGPGISLETEYSSLNSTHHLAPTQLPTFGPRLFSPKHLQPPQAG